MNDQNKQLAPWMDAIKTAKRKFEEINRVHNLVNYDKEAMFAMQVIKNNNYLMKIANNDPSSLRDAVINLAAIGISLNPAEKLAYLVPRKGKACLDISYMGLIKLATDTGSVLWARAELVRENDVFTYHGATEKPEFSTPNPFSRGNITGVYCVAKTMEGDYLTGIMSLDEVYDIRNRSEAWKAYQNDHSKTCPWVTDEGEMIKKTIIKREAKTWPRTEKSSRFDQAVHAVNEHEGIDFSGLNILGMRMDEMIDMDKVNISKVEEYYYESLRLIEDDDMDTAPRRFREIMEDVNNEEQTVLNKLLSQHKHNRKGYHTIAKEYAATYSGEQILENNLGGTNG